MLSTAAAALPPIDLSEPRVIHGASDRTDASVDASVRCANCQSTNVGRFCAECGAPRLETRPITVRRFLDDAWSELTSLGASTVLTIRALLAKPGELTRAYLDGRTRWYLPPLRVYLLAFGIYILGQSFMNDDYGKALKAGIAKAQTDALAKDVKAGKAPASLTPVAAGTPVNSARAQRRARAQAVMATLPTRVGDVILAASRNPWLAALNVFPVALGLSWLYRRRKQNYAEHVVMAIHVLAANSLLLLLNAVVHASLGIPRGHLDAVTAAHWLVIGTYFFFAARRVYGEAKPVTAGKSAIFVAWTQASMIVVPAILGIVVAVQVVIQAMLVSRA
jgi:Protein of unknown function (DUF3667).